MAFRKKMKKRASKRLFRKTAARTNGRNRTAGHMRGGIRM